MHRLFKLILFLVFFAATLARAAPSAQELEWFDRDDDQIFKSINAGSLVFLTKPPKELVHHHHNTLIILPETLQTGWGKLAQCHEHLDTFPSAQIVYNAERVRNIKITVKSNIELAWVEGSSIQLKNVGQNARLCMTAESRVLSRLDDGTFVIRSGPFMRKFLDGYFPMRVSMVIKLPPGLEFVSISPPEQAGFHVMRRPNGIDFDTWFEGRLKTEIHLQYKPVSPP